MKIRVIEPFRDVAFNNEIVRAADDIIDTTDPKFKCSIDLAKERIRRGFAVEVKDEAPQVIEETLLKDTKKQYGKDPFEEKVEKKGKKVSKNK